MFIVQISQNTEHTQKMVLKGHLLVTVGKCLRAHCLGVPGDRSLYVYMIIFLERWSLNGHSLVGMTQVCMFIIQVSKETEHIALVALYSEDRFEMF